MANIINPNMDSINASMAQVEQDLKALVPGMGVIAKRSGDTQYTADSEAYSYRKTPSSAGGAVNIESIVGASVGYNQIHQDVSNTSTVGGVTFTKNGDGSYTLNGTCTARGNFTTESDAPHVAGHVALFRGWKKVGNNQGYFGFGGVDIDKGNGGIYVFPESRVNYRLDVYAGDVYNNVKMYPQVYDLTAMLGTDIADYIYSLEQANAGAGVAYFEKYFGTGYHAYNAGSIVSVNTSGRRAVGKNLCPMGAPNQTANGLTFTVTNGTIIVNGTATGNGNINIAKKSWQPFLVKGLSAQYTLSGCPSGGSTSTYYLALTDNAVATYFDEGNGTTFTLNEEILENDYTVRFYYKTGATFNNAVLKPMLRFAETDSDFEPYKGITYPTTASDLRGICERNGVTDSSFNRWDEVWQVGELNDTTGVPMSGNSVIAKNYFKVSPNTTYYSNITTRKFFYDANKNFISHTTNTTGGFVTPNNAYYMKLRIAVTNYGTVYKNDCCINVSKTEGSPKNGDYVIADCKLTADGDVYLPSGQVTRKYGIVDLGTLNWTLRNDTSARQAFNVGLTNMKVIPDSATYLPNYVVSGKFTVAAPNTTWQPWYISQYTGALIATANPSQFADAAAFKAAVSGTYLVYELATPTTETFASYSAVQNAFADGTEEWLDTRSVAMPVPNSAQYASNEQDKLNSLMGAAGADGTYIVAQESGQMRLAELKTREIYFAPTSALSANSYGLFTIPNPDEIKNAQVIVATSLAAAHPSAAAGYQLTGRAGRGSNIYISYYAPHAIAASDADFNVNISYIV